MLRIEQTKKITSFPKHNIKPEYVEVIFHSFGNKSVEENRFQEENVFRKNAPR